ncbi:rod shape-determining protein MreC [Zhouia sp. PK063]|uniref:rod shape-determining protein MreC n=1 Tax=Zhouia sp. PK063 TaxID=3373602 RepID=UPI0037BBD885
MQQIVNFFIRNKSFILFLLLFCVSLGLTIQSHSYHRTKFINSANWATGGIYKSANNIHDYFHLKEYNRQLLEENKRLRTALANDDKNIPIDSLPLDSATHLKYQFFPADVIKNSYALYNNFITIDKGANDSIAEDMGVITSKGVVGIVSSTSKHYASILSVLNSETEINAKIKNTNYFGTLKWDGKDFKSVQLLDIQRLAKIKVGDTVTTGGMSTIFPEGILIGKVSKVVLDQSENYHIITVNLFNDMSNLGHVYVIKNNHKQEILNLQNESNE